jgi:hypothetical protein
MRRSKLKAFPSNNEGNVAIILAAALPLIVGTIGGGIDLARASRMRAALSQAVDSASAQITEARFNCAPIGKSPNIDIGDCTVRGGEQVAHLANRLIKAEFQNAGFNTKLEIDPRISVNPANGRPILRATASYNCTIFKLLSPSCDVTVGAASHQTAESATGSRRLTLQVPPLGEIWLDEFGSPALPTAITATGGTGPYKYAIGPNLPEGLRLNEASGTISGKPSAGQCTLDCLPQTRRVAVSAYDSSLPNRLEAAGVITYQVIFPLKLTIESPIPGKSGFPSVTRKGGKPPFHFQCAGSNNSVTCDPSTGRIIRLSGGGEFTISVIDSRGMLASAKSVIPQ